ncbi:MAG: hypothetical protein JWM11_2331 [Planctomycetaceae bacterium]|nr:hypothetical protein [Planctomycetaceae bacterium]
MRLIVSPSDSHPRHTVLIAAILVAMLASHCDAADPAAVDFNRDVRPILAGYCFKCHGPDSANRQAKLRLDVRDSALAKTDSGIRAIVPGNPQESELARRILSNDPEEQMPPRASKPLSDAQKQTLLRWVTAGAEYQPHWAFMAPRQSQPTVIRDSGWPRNPIDRFVLARLEAKGLRPSSPASRFTLVRRVYLDLIGLPPTIEEADSFVNDPAPQAYERLVDRLLASPHYGERWARQWLDLARYADTNGYEEDKSRSIWPYRDWVIKALNDDLPFDQFSIEQIAGDMLPQATVQQRIATGFHRNSMLNTESGVDPLEYRFYSLVDRVNTTSTIWLGLTLGCAQCHTHKYDPVPQHDYYQFLALMNQTEELEIDAPQADLVAEQQRITAQIDELLRQLPNEFPIAGPNLSAAERQKYLEDKCSEWRREASKKSVRWKVLRPTRATANVPALTILKDDSVLAIRDTTKHDEYDLELTTDLQNITAIRLETLPDDRLPAHGPGRLYYEGQNGTFFLCEFSLFSNDVPLSVGRTHQTAGNAKLATDGDPLSGWTFQDRQGLPSTALFELVNPLATSTKLRVRMMSERAQPCAVGRFRISVTADPWPAELSAYPADIEALLATDEMSLTATNRQQLMQYFLETTPLLAKQNQAIAEQRKRLPAMPTTMVMSELAPEHRRASVSYRRGEYLQPDAAVEPNVLSILPPLPAAAPRDRLALARWLVDPTNPLVGRVTMNRHWAAFFQYGLVRSVDDFGYQGAPPSHPELLDWLALELIRQGWSIKQMHRLIVTSATYQQASNLTDDLAAKDPQNVWLARGPRHRLQAEQIRDLILVASGQLGPQIGGPSVYPPQPPGATEGPYTALKWKPSEGADRYRRGLYTFIKRTQPFAMLNTFDAPEGRVCVATREISNSPLQALTMLNDPTVIEAAQAMGRSTAAASSSTEERVIGLFRRCLSRFPTDTERTSIIEFYEATRKRLQAGTLATDIGGPGTGDPVERAAWTVVARALLNLDEVIFKD